MCCFIDSVWSSATYSDIVSADDVGLHVLGCRVDRLCWVYTIAEVCNFSPKRINFLKPLVSETCLF